MSVVSARFGVVTAVTLKIRVLWHVKMCNSKYRSAFIFRIINPKEELLNLVSFLYWDVSENWRSGWRRFDNRRSVGTAEVQGEGASLEKLTGSQIIVCFGTWRYITVSTKACNLSVSWDISIQSMLRHPTSWRYNLTRSSHLILGLQSRFFPSVFPIKTLYAPLLFLIRSTCPTIPFLFIWSPYNICWAVQIMKFLIM